MEVMNRSRSVLAVLALSLAASSCGTSSTLTQRWSDETYTGQPGQKMMVIALTPAERNMLIWEGAFSSALQSSGVTPIAGSKFIPHGTKVEEAALKQTIRESGANLVAVTRVLAVDKEQEYVPGSSYYTPAPGYYGMYGYYHSSYAFVSSPGYIQENTIVKLETNVYDVGTEKLVWSGVSETLNPETAQDVANSVAMMLVDDMRKSKVIRKG
jgi:hypothetical protein